LQRYNSVLSTLLGYNAAMLAYGQTGTGRAGTCRCGIYIVIMVLVNAAAVASLPGPSYRVGTLFTTLFCSPMPIDDRTYNKSDTRE
jgi:hypothetical protein